MKPRTIRIPKTLLWSCLASFATLAVMSLLAFALMIVVPGTPFAQIQRYEEISNHNPAVYNTQLYQTLAPIASEWDWLYIAPASFLVAGVTFGAMLIRKATRLAVARQGAVFAVVLSLLIIGLSWLGLVALQQFTVGAGYAMALAMPDPHYLLMVVVQTALWTFAYVIGALAGTLLRRSKAASTRPTSARAA